MSKRLGNLQPYQAAAHRHWRARIIQYSRPMSSTTGFGRHRPARRRASRDACASPATSRSPTATRCSAAIADGTSRLTGYAPGADCAATLACLEALGVRDRRGRTGDRHDRRARARRPARARRAARRRQLRHVDAPARRPAGRAPVQNRDRRRRLALRPPDAPGHRAADPHGRVDRRRGRPAAAHDRRHGPARNFPRPRGAERPGEKRGPARRTARARAGRRSSSRSPHGIIRSAPSHAFGVPVDPRRRRGRRSRAASACSAIDAADSRATSRPRCSGSCSPPARPGRIS